MAVTADPSFKNPRNLGAADFRDEITPLDREMRLLARSHNNEVDFRAAALRVQINHGIRIFHDDPETRIARAQMERIVKERWPQR